MANYQGRALDRRRRDAGRGPSPGLLKRLLRIAVVLAIMAGLAVVPWQELRRTYAVVTGVEVEGVRYLDVERVRRAAAVQVGDDLLDLDLAAIRQRVMRVPRIQDARVARQGLRGIRVLVRERVPALAVLHGEPWEVDTSGVLLEPLQRGVVADVPLLTGYDASRHPPGAQLRTAPVQRGLAWTATLSHHALRLAGRVSEVDVSQPRITRLVLIGGTRVVGPAWPVSVRQLSGLLATLADLEQKGTRPEEVDIRFEGQYIVRNPQPVAVAGSEPSP